MSAAYATLLKLHARLNAALQNGTLDGIDLGEISYIADWTIPEQAAYADGLKEALEASQTENNPEIVRAYIRIMSKTRPKDLNRPDFDGNLSSMADDDLDKLAARLERRGAGHAG